MRSSERWWRAATSTRSAGRAPSIRPAACTTCPARSCSSTRSWSGRVPLLEKLRDESQETVIFGKRQADAVVYLQVVPGPHSIRYSASPGEIKPLHSSAIGKSILGSLKDGELRKLLEELPLPADHRGDAGRSGGAARGHRPQPHAGLLRHPRRERGRCLGGRRVAGRRRRDACGRGRRPAAPDGDEPAGMRSPAGLDLQLARPAGWDVRGRLPSAAGLRAR